MSKEVDIKIKKLLLSKFKQDDERIDDWLKTVAKNYYYKNSLFIDEFGRFIEKTPDNYLDASEMFESSEVIFNKIRHIIDYLKSTSAPLRISRLSFDDADRLSNEWVIQLNKKSSLEENEGDIKIEKKLDNGYSIVKLITEQGYKREGKIMGHCIASYYGDDNDSIIYSLRDKNNTPCCTVETSEDEDDPHILEIEGKFNKTVQDKHINAAKEMIRFLMSKLNVLPENIDDLDKIKSFAVNDNIISVDEIKDIPENTVMESYFYFQTEDKIDIEIPKGLHFKESFNIKTNGNLKINDNVQFDKSLSLSSKNLIISKSSKLNGSELMITNCENVSNYPIVPNELSRLMIDRTNIDYIPKNLKVIKDLSFCHNKALKKIDNISAQHINMHSSGIQYIGDNVEAQEVNLKQTNITLENIPKNAKISGYKIDENHKIKFSLKYKFLKEDFIAFTKKTYRDVKYKIKSKKGVYYFGTTGQGKSSTLSEVLALARSGNVEEKKLPILYSDKKSKILILKEFFFNKTNQFKTISRKIIRKVVKTKVKKVPENHLSELGYSRYSIMNSYNIRKVSYKNSTFEYNKSNIHIEGICSSIKRSFGRDIDRTPQNEEPIQVVIDEYGHYSR